MRDSRQLHSWIRILTLATGATTISCSEPPAPAAPVQGHLTYQGRIPGVLAPQILPVSGAQVTAQGQTTTSSSDGTFNLGLDSGITEFAISADGFRDTIVSRQLVEGLNIFTVDIRPTPEILLGSTQIRMSGPGVARTSLRFGSTTGGLVTDPMPTITTTGPFTAERGGQGYRDRSIKITATGPGTGSVTVSYDGASTTLQVEAVSLKFKAIDINTANACGIALDDSAWCWGGNDGGQLGADTPYLCNGGACQYGGREGNETPLPVGGQKQFAQIATAGFDCTSFVTKICGVSCALVGDGRPWCWGGQLGTPSAMAPITLARLSLRTPTPSGSPLSPITCGHGTDGKAWCFTATTVTPDGGGMTFQSYSAGRVHACGVDLSGDVYCWGSNTDGALGIGRLDSESHAAPEKAVASVKFSSVEVGEHSTCALATTGAIYCWGSGFGGTAVNPPIFCVQAGTCQVTPVVLPGSASYVAFARGQYTRACGLTAAGSVDCWTNFSGQPTTAPVPPLTTISVGNGSNYPYGYSGSRGLPYSACGLTADHIAYCWAGTTVYKIAQP